MRMIFGANNAIHIVFGSLMFFFFCVFVCVITELSELTVLMLFTLTLLATTEKLKLLQLNTIGGGRLIVKHS